MAFNCINGVIYVLTTFKMSNEEIDQSKKSRASRKRKVMDDYLTEGATSAKDDLRPKKGRFSGEKVEPPPLRTRHLPSQVSLINHKSK